MELSPTTLRKGYPKRIGTASDFVPSSSEAPLEMGGSVGDAYMRVSKSVICRPFRPSNV